ncbi:unnamed protein product [Closterium sp. NIES-65]|nr:unnamed protein product [Closterium sp. NIES-65]
MQATQRGASGGGGGSGSGGSSGGNGGIGGGCGNGGIGGGCGNGGIGGGSGKGSGGGVGGGGGCSSRITGEERAGHSIQDQTIIQAPEEAEPVAVVVEGRYLGAAMAHPGQCKDEASGLEKVVLRQAGGATAEVFFHGGHVTSWKHDGKEENLFMSSKAIFKPPKAIRGGIPVCFPQFGPMGPLDQHGYARNRSWSLDPASPNTDPASLDLLLTPSPEDLRIWPHSFELRMKVALGRGGELLSSMRVLNTDSKALSFTCALHTYFRVSDISEVRIEGLETLDYFDNLDALKRVTDQGDSITFDSEFDRIYLNTPAKVAIVDHAIKKTYLVKKDGFLDAVVWNPWEKKARAMSDMGEGEYKRFVCVEAAAIEKPVQLKPGEEWRAGQELSVVPSSYHSGQLDPTVVTRGY